MQAKQGINSLIPMGKQMFSYLQDVTISMVAWGDKCHHSKHPHTSAFLLHFTD